MKQTNKNHNEHHKHYITWTILFCLVIFIILLSLYIYNSPHIVMNKSKCSAIIVWVCNCKVMEDSVNCLERDNYIKNNNLGWTSKVCSEKLIGYNCTEVFIK